MDVTRFIPLAIALLAAPLLFGIINRTKAFFAGRRGSPLLQLYFDIAKLMRKGVTYSNTTTWVFRAGPVLVLSATIVAVAFVPMGGIPAISPFPGDILLFAYLLAMTRFMTIIAALDTGSSFEGMGASREAFFSALAEPALLLGVSTLVYVSGQTSLSGIFASVNPAVWGNYGPALALVAIALGAVLLVECSRIPIDDPNTHLELTMIHEVMILDNSGPDLGIIEYASSLKLWAFGSLIVGLAVPVRSGILIVDCATFLVGMLVLAVLVGTIESTMGRLRLTNVPRLISGAIASAVLAWALILR
ncbi:MAG: NADH-quinone oxidoreductase subunit H [Candidatus Brocadiia bacterium]